MKQKPAGSALRKASVAELLEPTAAKLFWQQGYANSSTRELAAILGVQSGSLYYYMDGKEGLLFDICNGALDRLHNAVREASDSAEEDARLKTAIRCHVLTTMCDRDSHATMLIEMRALSARRRSKIVKKRDEYRAFLTSLIVEGQEAGRIRNDVAAKFLTLGLLNLLNWSIFWFDPSGPLDSESLADILITTFIDGAGVRETTTQNAERRTRR